MFQTLVTLMYGLWFLQMPPADMMTHQSHLSLALLKVHSDTLDDKYLWYTTDFNLQHICIDMCMFINKPKKRLTWW